MATIEGAEQRPANVEEVLTPSNRREVLVEAPEQAKPQEEAKDAPDYTKTIDRMGNELGELRRQNKELLSQLQSMQVPQTEEPKATFAEDPETFIQQSIQAALEGQLAPKLQVLESDLLKRQGQAFDDKLSEVYSDWRETAQSDDFAEWVKASPARIQMYQIADSNYDVDSAVELLKRFKQDQAEAMSNQQGALNAAGMVQGGGDTGGARVYAASEVRKMMTDDPDGYRRWLAGDGMKAYQEGRVDQNS